MSSPKVEDTLGAALIGFSVSCIVFGILSTEVFTYYSRYPRDPNGYKLLVAFVWLLEFVDQGSIGHFIYYYMISNFTKPLVFFAGDVVWTLLIQVVLGAAAGTIVKCCFAMRVWRFSNHDLPLTALIIFLSLGQFGLAITYTVQSFGLKKLMYADRLKLIATLALGTGALTDRITAFTFSYYLRKLRTGYKKSDLLVNKLSLYAINT
ncbi:hypothetical protein MPER_08240, partial [Moniliophthora perniciosa FA553]